MIITLGPTTSLAQQVLAGTYQHQREGDRLSVRSLIPSTTLACTNGTQSPCNRREQNSGLSAFELMFD
jgi:hypothetical protein